MDNTDEYLDTLPLVDALWWFIENEHECGSDVFFYLRERYRNERQEV